MPQSDIMIVDDNPANLKLLADMLLEQGHQVRSFPLGRLALTAAKKRPPDLILLDINMPEMNGYEVCEILKSSEDLVAVPVIFLSALNEVQDQVKAFRCGAADYISKPFRFEEVHARVEVHLALQAARRVLQRQNEHLEEAVALRTRELSIANRRLTLLDQSKSDFLNLISHEFRTPLNGLLGISEVILSSMPLAEDLQSMYRRCRQRILSILDDAILLAEIDGNGTTFKTEPVSLTSIVSRARANATDLAEFRNVKLSAPTTDLGFVAGDERLLTKALSALLETAVKFTHKGETTDIRHEAAEGVNGTALTIDGRGSTIPESHLPKFFDLFAIGEALTPGGDLGVGPALAQRILSLFGGGVSVTNREAPPGIRLTVEVRRR